MCAYCARMGARSVTHCPRTLTRPSRLLSAPPNKHALSMGSHATTGAVMGERAHLQLERNTGQERVGCAAVGRALGKPELPWQFILMALEHPHSLTLQPLDRVDCANVHPLLPGAKALDHATTELCLLQADLCAQPTTTAMVQC